MTESTVVSARGEDLEYRGRGPGAILRGLREAKRMDRGKVAAQLHLSVAMVEAIEADNFEALPDSVFVQGYLRNYARLLGHPADGIMEAYRTMNPDGEPPAKLGKPAVHKQVRSSHFAVRTVTYVIVLSLLGFLVLWWKGETGAPRLADDVREAPATPSVFNSDAVADRGVAAGAGGKSHRAGPRVDAPVEPPPPPLAAPEERDMVSDDSATESAARLQETEMAAGQSVLVDETVAAEEPPKFDRGEQPVAGPVAAAVPDASEDASPGGQAKGPNLIFEFGGACWADIRDASGKHRIIGVMPKGARRTMDGSPPFRVVLGNSQVVTVSINGKQYDHSQHARGNVSRFTLEASDF